jgi:hypothetical protein
VCSRYGSDLAIDRSAAHGWSAKSEAFDHVLEFCWKVAAPAIVTRFARKPGQSMLAVALQPTMECPTWDLLLARQLCQWHAVFEVPP